MYSGLALLMTVIEVAAAITGYVLKSQLIFYNVIMYASPFYLLQHAFGPDSLLYDKPIYWVFAAYHLIKYWIIIMAQRRDDPNVMRNCAMILEALYLVTSTYYLL